ncbi:hypothetical protein SNEBB_004233 [Seison nebaliae]|nr:hypothetical protein SNEBB_004233 [Seison nebaliae]
MSHYFHNSLNSNIYDRISLQIYDGNKVVMEIIFKNVGSPNTFNWFSKDRIEDIKIFDPVQDNVIGAIKSSPLTAHRIFSSTKLEAVFISETLFGVFYPFATYIGCSEYDIFIPCYGKSNPVITYQTNSYVMRNDMSYATHIVLTGFQLNKWLMEL